MADNSNDIKYYKEELEKAIEDGVELFKHYKEISKDFQEQKKNLMNNKFKNLFDKKLELIKNKRKGLFERKNLPEQLKAKKIIELANEEKFLKSDKYRESYNKMSEVYLVNSNKKFLKEKEKLRKEKKRILSRIRIALAQLKKKMFKNEFKDLIKYMKETTYEVSNDNTITFMKLMHHLESAEITEEASKKTKKINDLETINNIEFRKSEMEYEIDKLRKERKNSKKNNEKIKLLEKLSKIKQKIIKIYEKNFKGVNIPKKFLDVIKILKQQQSLSKEEKEKINILEKVFNVLILELKKLQ